MKNEKILTIIGGFAYLLITSFSSYNSNSDFHLFKIERNKDRNIIYYDVQVTSTGKLNTKNPIKIYWVKREEHNQLEDLTWIQNSYSYGINLLSSNEYEAKFQFVSYSKRTFYIKKNSTGEFRVYTNSMNEWVEIQRIFIQIDGGTFWFPSISRVELHSKNSLSENSLVEIIKP
jgi:hypothetical protein